jgi:hypothetical protein
MSTSMSGWLAVVSATDSVVTELCRQGAAGVDVLVRTKGKRLRAGLQVSSRCEHFNDGDLQAVVWSCGIIARLDPSAARRDRPHTATAPRAEAEAVEAAYQSWPRPRRRYERCPCMLLHLWRR